MGEIDPRTRSDDEHLQLTPEQAATRTWKPDAATWAKIKQQSVKSPATIAITGFADDPKRPVSGGSVTISTSRIPSAPPSSIAMYR